MDTSQAILAHALAKHFGKEADRDSLPVGSFSLFGQVSGKVDGRTVGLPFAGLLAVGEDNETHSNVAVDKNELLAVFLSRIQAEERAVLLNSLVDHLQEFGSLPRVERVHREEAARLFRRLNTRVAKTRRGNVVFTPH